MKVVSFFVALVLLLSATQAVFAPIKFPHTIYGAVYIDGVPAPSGTAVSCFINGAQHNSGAENGATPNATVLPSGEYIINVGGDDGVAPKEGAIAGDAITFAVNGRTVERTITFSPGGTTKLDLVIGAAPTPPPANNPPPAPPSSSGSSGATPSNSGSSFPASPASGSDAPVNDSLPQNNAGNPVLPKNNPAQEHVQPPAATGNATSYSGAKGEGAIRSGVQDSVLAGNESTPQTLQIPGKELLAAAGLACVASAILLLLVFALVFLWKRTQRKGI